MCITICEHSVQTIVFGGNCGSNNARWSIMDCKHRQHTRFVCMTFFRVPHVYALGTLLCKNIHLFVQNLFALVVFPRCRSQEIIPKVQVVLFQKHFYFRQLTKKNDIMIWQKFYIFWFLFTFIFKMLHAKQWMWIFCQISMPLFGIIVENKSTLF